MGQTYNFNPGPAVLPQPVLEQIQHELLDYQGRGISILEMSHRSKEYMALNSETETLIKELLSIPAGYRVLFLQGGASTQFAMVPLNFLAAGTTADYVVTGGWAEKALDEATKIGKTHVAATTKQEKYRRTPELDEIHLSADPVYVHITSNNTLYGTQWQTLPTFGDVPIIADMSSDFLSRPFDITPYALIYGGAQKNIGPAGATVVIVREDWLTRVPASLPTMLRYDIFAKNDSLYNTPPVFAVYVSCLVLRWLRDLGGLAEIARRNTIKAAAIYDVIDASGDFYRGHAEKTSRSLMNITFRLPSEAMEQTFINGAQQEGFIGLAGHRSVGGIRASTYNAMTLEGAQALAGYMREFQRTEG